jgi:hypothetical protein
VRFLRGRVVATKTPAGDGMTTLLVILVLVVVIVVFVGLTR